MSAAHEKIQPGQAASDDKLPIVSQRLSDPNRRYDWLFMVMEHCSLKCLPTAMFLALKAFPVNRKKREIWASYETIASKIGSNTSTVKRSTAEMTEKGFLQRYRPYSKPYYHFLSFPKGAESPPMEGGGSDPTYRAESPPHTGRNSPLNSGSEPWKGDAKASPLDTYPDSQTEDSREPISETEQGALLARQLYPEISLQEHIQNQPFQNCVRDRQENYHGRHHDHHDGDEDEDDDNDDCPF